MRLRFTVATGRVQPWHTHALTHLHCCYTLSECHHNADAFMVRYETQCGLERLITVAVMQIGVASATSLDFDQDLAGRAPYSRQGSGDACLFIPGASHGKSCDLNRSRSVWCQTKHANRFQANPGVIAVTAHPLRRMPCVCTCALPFWPGTLNLSVAERRLNLRMPDQGVI